MSYQVILVALVFLTVLAVFFSWRWKERKKTLKLPDDIPPQDEMVAVKAGKHTIYLREGEVENYYAQPRKMRKQLINKYNKMIRKGELVPIVENGVTKGYITKKDFHENNDG